GVLYQVNGNHEKALEISLRVLDRMKRSGEANLLPYYANTGTIYLEKGEYAYAIAYFDQAIKKGNPENLSMMATCHNNMGQAQHRLNHMTEAISSFRQSIALYNKADRQSDRKSLSDAYNNLASCYLSREQPDSALAVINQARNEIPSVWSRDPLSWHTLGVTRMKKGDIDKAYPYLLTGLRLHKEKYGEAHPYQATIYTDLARLARAGNKPGHSISYVDSALAIVMPDIGTERTAPNNKNGETAQVAAWYALREKANILTELTRHDSTYLEPAMRVHRQSVSLLEDIRKTLATDESGTAWSTAAHPVLESGILMATQSYDLTGSENYMEDALRFAEKNKSVKLLESTLEAIAALNDPYLDSITALEEKINRELAMYRRKLAGSESESRKKVWQDRVFELKQDQDKLLTALRQGTPAYYRQRYIEEGLHTDSIRQLFTSASDLFIEYFVGREQVWAIWLTSDQKGVYPIGSTAKLRSRVAAYLAAVSTRPSLSYQNSIDEFGHLTSLGHGLYQELLHPAMKHLPANAGGGRLIIIPDGWLSYLPFESLLTDETAPDATPYYSDLPYLVSSYTISYAYSAGLLISPGMGQSAAPNKGIGIYAPYTSSDHNKLQVAQTEGCNKGKLYVLACSNQETEGIRTLMDGELVEGGNATRGHFQQYAGSYQVLHLATHACLDPYDPTLNRIYLADDYLTTSELYGMKLNARMAVLSACNTGSGELVAGEGVMSLGRGLAYAGVESMVTSLWPIDDCTTSNLMVNFYRELLGSEPMAKDEALRAAKLSFMQSSEDILAHPYYWAAFIHTGKWTPLDTDSMVPSYTENISLKWWRAGCLVMILALLGFSVKKVVA
ncbi:MAG: CHAT domain-containing protein, partial [Cyclobacteriaceae bacterium]